MGVNLREQWWQEFTDVGEGTIIDALFRGKTVRIQPLNWGRDDAQDDYEVEIIRVVNVGIGLDSTEMFSFVTVDVEELAEDLFVRRIQLMDSGHIQDDESAATIGRHNLSVNFGD